VKTAANNPKLILRKLAQTIWCVAGKQPAKALINFSLDYSHKILNFNPQNAMVIQAISKIADKET
jgi:hypothetical protein